jgi:hypothetical protein
VDLGGAYYKQKDQVSALEQLREKLPSLDTPSRRRSSATAPTAQLSSEQVEQLVDIVSDLGDGLGELCAHPTTP